MWKKIMVIVLLVPVLYIAVVLIHGTVADVQPAAVSSVEVLSEGNTAEIQNGVLYLCRITL